MKTFSERLGIKPIKVEIQRESADQSLRTALWNEVYLTYFHSVHFHLGANKVPTRTLLARIWISFFERNYDDMNGTALIVELVKDIILNSAWNVMYEVVEFLPKNYDSDDYKGSYDSLINERFYDSCNVIFERHLSGYRFVNELITEITSSIEIKSIESALAISDRYAPVKTHLERALQLFSDFTNPDYRNSIKESISAIESLSGIITDSLVAAASLPACGPHAK